MAMSKYTEVVMVVPPAGDTGFGVGSGVGSNVGDTACDVGVTGVTAFEPFCIQGTRQR